MNEIKKCIFDILDENGIYIDSNEMEEDLDLREYILDSLQYVYIIVELEDRLGQMCIRDSSNIFEYWDPSSCK